MIAISQCPICGQFQLESHSNVKDNSITKESFELLQCSSCQFILTSPQPELDQIGHYYASDNYISHSDTNAGLVNKIYRIVRQYTLKKKLALIQTYNINPNLIDIGSGAGHFLAYCQQAGIKCIGVEPDARTRQTSINNFNISVFDEDYLDQIQPDNADIISLWHVLEHVPALNQKIHQIIKILKPNAYLIIAVPNCNSFDAKYYKEFWAGFDVPRHFWHFTPATINKLLSANKFTHVRTLPMYFDAFYVSMLSEKYKNSFAGFAKGIFIGLISNLVALFSKTPRYSSQIYIYRKN